MRSRQPEKQAYEKDEKESRTGIQSQGALAAIKGNKGLAELAEYFDAQTCLWNGSGAASNTKRSIHAYDCVNNAKRGLEKCFRLYNQERPHSSLDDKTPNELYFGSAPHKLGNYFRQ